MSARINLNHFGFLSSLGLILMGTSATGDEATNERLLQLGKCLGEISGISTPGSSGYDHEAKFILIQDSARGKLIAVGPNFGKNRTTAGSDNSLEEDLKDRKASLAANPLAFAVQSKNKEPGTYQLKYKPSGLEGILGEEKPWRSTLILTPPPEKGAVLLPSTGGQVFEKGVLTAKQIPYRPEFEADVILEIARRIKSIPEFTLSKSKPFQSGWLMATTCNQNSTVNQIPEIKLALEETVRKFASGSTLDHRIASPPGIGSVLNGQ